MNRFTATVYLPECSPKSLKKKEGKRWQRKTDRERETEKGRQRERNREVVLIPLSGISLHVTGSPSYNSNFITQQKTTPGKIPD